MGGGVEPGKDSRSRREGPPGGPPPHPGGLPSEVPFGGWPRPRGACASGKCPQRLTPQACQPRTPPRARKEGRGPGCWGRGLAVTPPPRPPGGLPPGARGARAECARRGEVCAARSQVGRARQVSIARSPACAPGGGGSGVGWGGSLLGERGSGHRDGAGEVLGAPQSPAGCPPGASPGAAAWEGRRWVEGGGRAG